MQTDQQPVKSSTDTKPVDSKWKMLAKRGGIAAFLFFLIKGLMWIAAFTFGVKMCS
jgi:hypothetical protein